MNPEETKQAEELIEQPITEETLQPLVPTFPEPITWDNGTEAQIELRNLNDPAEEDGK